MNRFQKMRILLLAFVMLLWVAGCTNPDAIQPTDAPEDYTIRVASQVGMPQYGVYVYVYANGDMKTPVQVGVTGQSGEFRFSMPALGEYTVTLRNLPQGTKAEPGYTFTGNTAEIRLSVALASDDPGSTRLGLGSQMPDFSVVTSEGETLTLSRLLQEKKMVMLNFWFVNCGFCVREFPYMEQAYQAYQDDIAIVALNPLDDPAAIAPFKTEHGLSFPMASCDGSLRDAFGVIYYPTSVIIDRDGVVRLVGVGGIDDPEAFKSCFAHFIGDTYDTMYYNGIDEVAYDYEKNK